MQLNITWGRVVSMKYNAKTVYSVMLSNIPDRAGVYIFGRKYGRGFEALYVGKANKLRGRVKGQLNNLRLMKHLLDAKSGRRFVLAGEFNAKPGQRLEKCLPLIEKSLIRHFLSEGHDLVNISGTRLRQHEIVSAGKHPKKYFPRAIFLDSK